jgi:hypothetical protein
MNISKVFILTFLDFFLMLKKQELLQFKMQCCEFGSGIRCLFELWIRDPGWVKKQDLDPRSGSGMNNPDHFSESLETSFLC